MSVGAVLVVGAAADVVPVVSGAALFVGAAVGGVVVGGGASVGVVSSVGGAAGGAVFRWRCAASVNGVFRQSPVSSVHSLSLGLTVLCAALFSYPWSHAASLLFLVSFLSLLFFLYILLFPHPFLQSRPWRPFRAT